MKRTFETKQQDTANVIDCDLDRIARRAYEMREQDERWRHVSMKIDAARGIVRQMMHPKRVAATQ